MSFISNPRESTDTRKETHAHILHVRSNFTIEKSMQENRIHSIQKEFLFISIETTNIVKCLCMYVILYIIQTERVYILW